MYILGPCNYGSTHPIHTLSTPSDQWGPSEHITLRYTRCLFCVLNRSCMPFLVPHCQTHSRARAHTCSSTYIQIHQKWCVKMQKHARSETNTDIQAKQNNVASLNSQQCKHSCKQLSKILCMVECLFCTRSELV